ncbi:MAG TPA: fumarylacetoacetate hydrolase family protein [Gemmatimonadales bacterium]|nr:fumarylacetoacetate hydrolase family protein [Gemmatimonadales bacterium]
MIPLRPGKIVGVGRNYLEHARELGNELPAVPIIFLKPLSALLEPGGTIRLPSVSQRVEHEAEIGVVVGRRLHHATPEEAERGIGGFTCVNDVTCRDLQRQDGQWTRAKGFDTFCPVGPRVVAGLDWRALEICCRVNGVERQHGRASDMHFSIPALLSFISGIMTLEPGDLIATGTPAGVGPLTDGDVVEVEIPGIGVLSNPVRNDDGHR